MIHELHDEFIVRFILSNTFLFSVIFGALGGMIHTIETHQSFKASTLLKKTTIGIAAAMLLFFLSYDFKAISPAMRIALSFMAGFGGSVIIRGLTRFYFHHGGPSIFPKIPDYPKDDPKDDPKDEPKKGGKDNDSSS